MVRTTIASLAIPSFLPDGAPSPSSLIGKGDQALLSRVIPLPYPTGKATLQIGGVHLRLLRNPQSKPNPSRNPPTPRARDEQIPSSFSDREDDGLSFLITVKAVVRGELTAVAVGTREFVVGVCALGLKPNTADAEIEQTGGESKESKENNNKKRDFNTGRRSEGDPAADSARSKPPNTAPYAKRALNALARQEHSNQMLKLAGRLAPLSSSMFLRLDLRVQTERVRLVLEVHLLRTPHGDRVGDFTGNETRKRERHEGKRFDKGSDAASTLLSSVLASYGLDAMFSGTVSSLV